MRWLIMMAFGLALAGCASEPESLWPGPDWRAAGLPAATPNQSDSGSGNGPATDDTPTRVPQAHVQRGSGTPPDQLFPNPAERPQVVQPTAPPPVAPLDTNNPVLSPRDPKAPYSAQGYGYQREGTTIQGPTGGNYNSVGPSIFGPHGTSCHAVGTSLFCN